ncbi:unnamed protein product [Dibothriocephalus latus]|uniref:LIM zinc-binding domain-containing protein n=1 Tax=Dibothriocephalus latus TaxID=60516 RepID=A0A3P7LXL9_DIBLA|nr:unnamed protein product [Dibothriocephalus latus]
MKFKDLSFQDKHWHEACFLCSQCQKSLSDKPFATKDNSIYCPDCYDEKFAARCDACGKTFKAAMRKYEYKGGAWHEECFLCSECKQPIGTKSFIPRGDAIVCIACYEDKFAQKCEKCKQRSLKVYQRDTKLGPFQDFESSLPPVWWRDFRGH